MNINKVIAATVAVATLGVGGLAVAGVANAAPAPALAPASASAAPAATSPTHPVKALRRRLRRGIVVVSAKAIGITPQALVAQLKTGSSIAQVATAHSVNPNTVVTALVNAGTTRVNKAVANGKLSATCGAAVIARLPDLAQKAVNFQVAAR